MDTTTNYLTILIILLAMVVSLIFARRRREPFTLRYRQAFAAIPAIVGGAIEANRPLHLSYGSAGIGGTNTLLALASSEFFYHIARRAVIGDAAPILTTSDISTIPLAQDTLRHAYESRGLVARYRNGNVRWYPAGTRSLAFAAALTGVIGDDDVHASFLIGSFGTELALIAEAAHRRGQGVIAASSFPEGQAIAYAMSDEPLIGEEIFAAPAYLSDNPNDAARAATADVLRVLLVVGIFITTLIAGNESFASFFGQVIAQLSALIGGG